jgi:hypothetical protein
MEGFLPRARAKFRLAWDAVSPFRERSATGEALPEPKPPSNEPHTIGDWTTHPSLRGRFSSQYPDDLQVVVHDGHPPLSKIPAELIWVRVTGILPDVKVFGGKGHLTVFRGIVLNKPHRLVTVSHGSEIKFVMPETGPHPLYVTHEYLSERRFWRLLAGCKECGMSELLSPASELAKHLFPEMDKPPSGGFIFTTRCGICGGGQVVRIMRKALN